MRVSSSADWPAFPSTHIHHVFDPKRCKSARKRHPLPTLHPPPSPRPSPPPSLSPTLTSAANRRWEHKGRAPPLWTADCSTNFWTSGTFVPCLLCCVDAAGCWFSTEMWFLTQVLSAFTAGNGRYLPTTPPLVLGRWEWNIYINIYLYINVCISVNY